MTEDRLACASSALQTEPTKQKVGSQPSAVGRNPARVLRNELHWPSGHKLQRAFDDLLKLFGIDSPQSALQTLGCKRADW